LKQSHWRKVVNPCHFQNQSRSWQRKQDVKVKAKWNSAAQGRVVTRAMRAFRKPAARVEIPKKAQCGSELTTTPTYGRRPHARVCAPPPPRPGARFVVPLWW
jgi:hypothetical protein